MATTDYSKFSPFNEREGKWLSAMPDSNDYIAGESNIRRLDISSSAVAGITSGDLRLTYFTATRTETVSKIAMYSGGTAAAATPTLVKMALYRVEPNDDLTLVAVTANDTALFAAANTYYERAFTVPYAKEQGQRYAVGVLLITAVATPSFLGAGVSNSAVINVAPRIVGRIGGQTDIPSSITAASVITSGLLIYAEVLP